MTHGQDFKNYATKHLGLSGTLVDDVVTHQVTGNMTPYIIEEREMRMAKNNEVFIIKSFNCLIICEPVT